MRESEDAAVIDPMLSKNVDGSGKIWDKGKLAAGVACWLNVFSCITAGPEGASVVSANSLHTTNSGAVETWRFC